jgi:hypothetical protein
MLSGIAQLYAGFAGGDKHDFFEKALMGTTLQGYDKLGAIGAYTGFVARQEVEIFEKSYDVYRKLYDDGGMYTQMFMPQFVGYIRKGCDEKVDELNVELAGFEETNDVVYANQTRAKIAKFEAIKAKFAAFEIELTESKESSGH